MKPNQRISQIEHYARQHFSAHELSTQSVEVARRVARWRGCESQFSSAWGAHCSPGLFFALAAILDHSSKLSSVLARQPSFDELVDVVLELDLFGHIDLFEIGGQFLDSIDPEQSRCWDAKFAATRSLSLNAFAQPVFCKPDSAANSKSTLPNSAAIVIANGVFETGSGIAQTLIQGPTTQKQLLAVFGSSPSAFGKTQAYQAEQSAIAAFELFACAHNLLRPHGILAVSNIIAPDIVPSPKQLRWLGFCEKNAVFSGYSSHTARRVLTAVRLFEATGRGSSGEESAAVIEYKRSEDKCERAAVTRSRQRVWVWEGDRIRGDWRAC